MSCERFATRFAVILLIGYAITAAASTFVYPTRERHVFPISMMPMFRSIPSPGSPDPARLAPESPRR